MGNAESAFNTIKGNFLTYAQNSIGNVGNVEDTGDCTAGSLLGICDAGAIAEECSLREISASQVKNYGQGQINFNHEFWFLYAFIFESFSFSCHWNYYYWLQ